MYSLAHYHKGDGEMLLNHLIDVKRWVIRSIAGAYLRSREIPGGSYVQDSDFRQSVKKLPFVHIPRVPRPNTAAAYIRSARSSACAS